MGILRVGDHFRIVIDRKRHELDEVHIKVELTERVFIGELKDLGEVKCSVEDKLKAVLNLRTVGVFRGCWIWGESIEVVDVSEYVIFYKSNDSIAIVM